MARFFYNLMHIPFIERLLPILVMSSFFGCYKAQDHENVKPLSWNEFAAANYLRILMFHLFSCYPP